MNLYDIPEGAIDEPLDMAKAILNFRAEIRDREQIIEKHKSAILFLNKKIEDYEGLIRAAVPEGEKIKDLEVEISWRKSESVEIDESLPLEKQYIRHIEKWEPDKVKIKEAIKAGFEVEGASLITKQHLQIK